MVETSTENIEIGTPVSGIVSAIYVKWGDRVKTGDPLLKIDDRDLQGQLLVAVARVKEAEASLAKTKNLLKVAEGLRPGSSISEVEMANRRFDAAIDEAVLGSASAQVEQIKIEIERRTLCPGVRSYSADQDPTRRVCPERHPQHATHAAWR